MRALRPVGEAVPAIGGTNVQPLAGHSLDFFASGTMALAAILKAIIQRTSVTGSPEVLMPAYTCPDVVSAIAFAGAKAVLVDLERDRPWMSLSALKAAVGENTVALVAVNFQGIDERLADLRTLCDSAALPLVYDHCQAYPPNEAAMRHADALVFSFGRGKPASALIGGAVWCSDDALREALTGVVTSAAASAPSALKRFAYNRLIRPRAYSMLLRLPGVGIGETVFHPLHDLLGLDAGGIAAVSSAIDQHIRATGFEERRALWALRLSSVPEWCDLPRVCEADASRSLLRYTVLAPSSEAREFALNRLERFGLGATRLYPRPVNEIPGTTEHVISHDSLEGARDFADRLLTLPIHSDVKESDIDRAVGVLQDAAH
ncbi:MAG: DegT/DnrJ/EryC1/StrS family aminotransferase [Pseudomonadota bacterium]